MLCRRRDCDSRNELMKDLVCKTEVPWSAACTVAVTGADATRDVPACQIDPARVTRHRSSSASSSPPPPASCEGPSHQERRRLLYYIQLCVSIFCASLTTVGLGR